MEQIFDINIQQELTRRNNCSMFVACEHLYYNYFMNLPENELQKLVCVLPVGSLIFHSSPARNFTGHVNKQKHFPPRFPVLTNGLTAIKKVLNRENFNKTKFARKNDPNIKTILDEYNRKDTEGKFLGKRYMWCNPTIDTNIMVDIRLMKSMGAYITTKNIYLLDYFALGKLDQHTGINRVNFFKRSININPEYINPKNDNINDSNLRVNVNIKDMDGNDGLSLLIKNKYSNSLGDAVLISILNYVLAMRGFSFKIGGYTDYDVADATHSNIMDPNSRSIGGNLFGGLFVSREIMLSDTPSQVTYLSSHIINNGDVNVIKNEVLEQFIKRKLNNIVQYNNNTIGLKWCFNINDFNNDDPFVEWYKNYKNMRILPHYRYAFENIIDNNILIQEINNNQDKDVINDHVYVLDNKKIQLGGMNKEIDDETANIFRSKFKYQNIIEHTSIFKNISEFLKDKVIDKTNEEKYNEYLNELRLNINSKTTEVIQKYKINDLTISNYLLEVNKKMFMVLDKYKETFVREILSDDDRNQINDEQPYFLYLKGSNNMLIELSHYMDNFDPQFFDKDKYDELKILYEKLGLGMSDYDFNFVFNPKILESPRFNIYLSKFKIFFYNFFIELRNNLSELLKNEINKITFDINTKLFDAEKHVRSPLTSMYENRYMIENILEEKFINPDYNMPYLINRYSKVYDNIQPITPFKVTVNDTKYDDNIDGISEYPQGISGIDFVLIRFGFGGITNLNKNSLGECIDVSIIKNKLECNYLWDHFNDCINRDGIFMENYFSLFIDLNDTIIENINLGNTGKLKKRLDRHHFFSKFISYMKKDRKINDNKLQNYVDIYGNKWSIDRLSNDEVYDNDEIKLQIMKQINKDNYQVIDIQKIHDQSNSNLANEKLVNKVVENKLNEIITKLFKIYDNVIKNIDYSTTFEDFNANVVNPAIEIVHKTKGTGSCDNDIQTLIYDYIDVKRTVKNIVSEIQPVVLTSINEYLKQDSTKLQANIVDNNYVYNISNDNDPIPSKIIKLLQSNDYLNELESKIKHTKDIIITIEKPTIDLKSKIKHTNDIIITIEKPTIDLYFGEDNLISTKIDLDVLYNGRQYRSNIMKFDVRINKFNNQSGGIVSVPKPIIKHEPVYKFGITEQVNLPGKIKVDNEKINIDKCIINDFVELDKITENIVYDNDILFSILLPELYWAGMYDTEIVFDDTESVFDNTMEGGHSNNFYKKYQKYKLKYLGLKQ
jgi:hypothetical protein